MRKWLWALVPIVSLGFFSWMPFVVMGDKSRQWNYLGLTALYMFLLFVVPADSWMATLAGAYTVGLVISASILAFLFAKDQEEAALRAAHDRALPYKEF